MSGLLVDPYAHQRDITTRSYRVTGLVSHHGEELEFVQVRQPTSFVYGHVSMRSGHGSMRSGHVSMRSGHGSMRSGHVSMRSGHGSRRSGHVSTRSGHVSIRSMSTRCVHKVWLVIRYTDHVSYMYVSCN